MPRITFGNEHGVTLAIVAALTIGAAATQVGEKPEVPFPRDFRSWHHVKSIVVGPGHKSFSIRGGRHHYSANDAARTGYRTGTFPTGSVIVDEAVFTKDGQGDASGILLEGDRRGLDVMVKNDGLYKDTGGWGFEHFDRDGTTGVLSTAARERCYECHATQTERDHVFSRVRR
jgi:hypothetical protein